MQDTVTNICSKVRAAAHPFVGFNLDSSDVLRGPFPVQSSPCHLIVNGISMGDYLPRFKRGLLPIPDVYNLAITLISSVLQLSETPWLLQPWSHRDILFLRSANGDDGPINIQQPYLIRAHSTTGMLQVRLASIIPAFFKANGTLEAHSKPTRSELESRSDRLNLLALAIMLLEINVGEPIENLREQQDMGPDGNFNAWTDLSTAQRSLETHGRRGNLACAFQGAITYCLQCYLDPGALLSNYEFARTVEERVLEPLERELQSVFYGP